MINRHALNIAAGKLAPLTRKDSPTISTVSSTDTSDSSVVPGRTSGILKIPSARSDSSIRVDRSGTMIISGSKSHRVSFADEVCESPRPIAKVHHIESFKQWNMGNRFDGQPGCNYMLHRRTGPLLVRTGFYRSDPPRSLDSAYFFLDPDKPLYSTANEFRHTDDPTMRNPVLERSNVGMGFLLSNSKWCNFAFTNMLYKKLRNLEVNTLKRFTAFTSSDKKLTLDGINPRELLMVAGLVSSGNSNSDVATQYWKNLLTNQADLAVVLAHYYKPLLVQIPHSRNAASVIGSLSDKSSCYFDSVVEFDFCKFGIAPSGGLSYVLARCPFYLGEFFALTNRRVAGQSVLYSGLAPKWMSPEAFGFMEVASEHKLEVSEKDASALLSEYYLSPPKDWALSEYVPVISEVFRQDSVSDILLELEQLRDNSSDTKIREFSTECLNRMTSNCAVSMEVTNRLIKSARGQIADRIHGLESEHGIETADYIREKPGHAMEHIFLPALVKALGDEIIVSMNMLEDSAIRNNMTTRIHSVLRNGVIDPSEFMDFSNMDIKKLFSSSVPGFSYHARSEFPLSAHPKLRKYHPDFDPTTGMDHDPHFMRKEIVRWSDSFMMKERDLMRSAATGMTVDELRNRHDLVWE